MSSEYRIGVLDKVGLAQTKSLEAKNRKTTASVRYEKPTPKKFLPRNNNNGQRQRPRRKTRQRRQGGPKGNNDRGVIMASRIKTTEVIQRSIPLFSARTTKRLRYSTNIQLASTSGAVTSYVFAANGLFDPDVTGTGHQPMGFDEMMVYYNHYTVAQARLQAVCKCVSSTKMTVGIKYDGAATPVTVVDRLVEDGASVIEYLELGTTMGSTKRLEMGLDIARVQGISRKALTADTSLRGTSSANPSELSYFHVQVWDAAGQSGTVNIDIIIDFVAIFTEPRDATTSLLARLRELELKSTREDEVKTFQPQVQSGPPAKWTIVNTGR